MTEEVEDKRKEPGVEFFLKELKLSDKAEKDWREDAKTAIKTYRNEVYLGNDQKTRKDTFNILWSNTETQRPALFAQTPKPDIRRRFRDKDPVGKHVSELLERSTRFALDGDDFTDSVIAAVNDLLLPGRAITRVRYKPHMEEVTDEEGNVIEVVKDEEVTYEQWQWDDFRHGPGKTWSEVPWIAFRHKLTRREMEDFAPEFVDKVSYDIGEEDDKENEDKRTEKQCLVWEVWDKDDRQVKFLAPSFKDEFIKQMDDPMGLKDFWCIPRPMYAIESSTSLVPITEYSMYETLAKELEKMTNRIAKVISAIRVRGIYDSTMKEVEKLLEIGDNEMVPAENLSRLLEGGGLDKAIWMLPIDMMAGVVGQLYQQRQALVQQIYEVTGISDILRGASDPGETLGAQQIKANFGSQRLQRKQREVQRYCRDILRITAEIMAEQFSKETFERMTGLRYATQQEKMMIQQQLQAQQQQAMAAGQQPPPPNPEMQELLDKPAWEEIDEVLKSDILRAYKIDIETDSTIEPDQQADKQALAEMMQGLSQVAQALGPAVQGGMMSKEAAKQLVTSMVRKFRLGREVEDALEEEVQQQEQPDPEQAKAKLEIEQQQQEMEAEREKRQYEAQERQMEFQFNQREHDRKMREMNRKDQLDEAKFRREMTLLSLEVPDQGTSVPNQGTTQ